MVLVLFLFAEPCDKGQVSVDVQVPIGCQVAWVSNCWICCEGVNVIYSLPFWMIFATVNFGCYVISVRFDIKAIFDRCSHCPVCNCLLFICLRVIVACFLIRVL